MISSCASHERRRIARPHAAGMLEKLPARARLRKRLRAIYRKLWRVCTGLVWSLVWSLVWGLVLGCVARDTRDVSVAFPSTERSEHSERLRPLGPAPAVMSSARASLALEFRAKRAE